MDLTGSEAGIGEEPLEGASQSGRAVSEEISAFGPRVIRRVSKKKLFICGRAVFLLFMSCGGLGFPPGDNNPSLGFGKKTGVSEAGAKIGPMLKLSPLVINLNVESARHYIRATVVLEIGRNEWVEEVQRRIPSLTDMVILALGHKKSEDLEKPHSKKELKKSF